MRKLLLINNYENSGIGDFGKMLRKHIDDDFEVKLTYFETNQNWRSFFSIWSKILTFKGLVIFNLGFTSFGSSIYRNFLNFLMLGLVNNLKFLRMRVILHDSPEISDNVSAGYKHFDLLKAGAKVATQALRYNEVLVFSVELYNILAHVHKLKRVKLSSFPCFDVPTRMTLSKELPNKGIHIGYISKYKGLELLSEISKINHDCGIVVIGGYHAVLQHTQYGKNYLETLKNNLTESNVELTGYLKDEAIAKIFSSNNCIGVLPYIKTSGSSYSAIFFVERGIPVIATDLPEFIRLKNDGAGIELVKRRAEAFTRLINDLFNNEDRYNELVRKNSNYCKQNSVQKTVKELIDTSEYFVS